MDIQISYQDQVQIYHNVTSFEELIQEIQQRFPFLGNLEFSYQDEEGDQIQVSNTSDVLAIANPSETIIHLTGKLDDEKQQEHQKKLKVQEMKRKNRQQQIEKKTAALEKELGNYDQFTIQTENQTQDYQQKLNQIENELNQLKQFKIDPLPDFAESLNNSKIFNSVKEKEAQLQQLDDKKAYDTQLKSIQKEVQEIFHSIYSGRVQQYQENYKLWKKNKTTIAQLEQKLISTNQEMKKFEETIAEKKVKFVEKVDNLKNELKKLNEENNNENDNN